MTPRRTKYHAVNGRLLAARLRRGAPREKACASLGLTVKGVRMVLLQCASGESTHPARLAFCREVRGVWPPGKVGRPRKEVVG